MTKKAGKAVSMPDEEKRQAENKAREQFDDMQKVLKEGRE